MSGEQEVNEYLVPDIVEDFTFSDLDDDTEVPNKKAIHIDMNSKIVANFMPSFDNKKAPDGESCTIRYNNADSKHKVKSGVSPSTSSDEIEMSDSEGCSANPIDIQFTSENSHISIKSIYPLKSSMHADESNGSGAHNYGNMSVQEPILTNRKRSKKNMFNFYEAFAEQDKQSSKEKFSAKTWKVSDKKLLVTDDDDADDAILPDKSLLKTSNSQLEFIDMDSEENSTDTEDIILNNDVLQNTAKEKRAVYANGLLVKKSSDKADLTDDEALSDIDESMCHRRVHKGNNLEVDMTDDNDLTEEEELCDEINNVRCMTNKNKQNKEWTETDESGNVKHIKIKTETSIKVAGGGEEGESGDEEAVSRTTTSTRIVTTVTTGEVGTEEGEGGDELRTSMEAVLSQFMSDDKP